MFLTKSSSGPAVMQAVVPPVRSSRSPAATPPMKWASFSLAAAVAYPSEVGGKPATRMKLMSEKVGSSDTGMKPSRSSEPPPMMRSTPWRARFSKASRAAPGLIWSTTMAV